MISCINEKLMSNVSKTVSDSIWYDECYVHKLYLYAKLLLVPSQTMWQRVGRVRWPMMSYPSTDTIDYLNLSTVHHNGLGWDRRELGV
jgi:hypothetical protein